MKVVLEEDHEGLILLSDWSGMVICETITTMMKMMDLMIRMRMRFLKRVVSGYRCLSGLEKGPQLRIDEEEIND